MRFPKFCDYLSCSLADKHKYKYLWKTSSRYLQRDVFTTWSTRQNLFFQNAGNCQSKYTASHCKRAGFSIKSYSKPQTSHVQSFRRNVFPPHFQGESGSGYTICSGFESTSFVKSNATFVFPPGHLRWGPVLGQIRCVIWIGDYGRIPLGGFIGHLLPRFAHFHTMITTLQFITKKNLFSQH